jgi:hypothetical protein
MESGGKHGGSSKYVVGEKYKNFSAKNLTPSGEEILSTLPTVDSTLSTASTGS